MCVVFLEEFQAFRLAFPPDLGWLALLHQPFALLFAVPGLRGQFHLPHSVPALDVRFLLLSHGSPSSNIVF